MNEDLDSIANCQACDCSMDVSMLAPFTNVKCPECDEHNRVKIDVGAYVLKKRQGVGGMSLVFGAVDKTLGREVAIKILNEDYSMDEKRIAQFEQEARITAAISHPHIVKVFTVGQAFRRFFIAMELVSGGSLEQKMAENTALPENEILNWAQQIADGLSAANDAGLIHRDIKPGNILFDKDGHVKIVDFGLALVTQGGKAQADEIWATPYYVPPEALDVLEEDFRSDIYALGASLFHALSGKPPFAADTRSTTELKEIKRKLPSLKAFAPWLNDETCAVIDKAMAFEMDDRYGSYNELIEALHFAEVIVNNNGVRPPVHGEERARRHNKDNSGKIVAIGLAALVLIGGLIAVFMMGGDDSGDSTDTDSTTQVITPVQDNGGIVSKRVAIEISAARSSLKNRNYRDAYRRYSNLASDNKVPADTVYWAGLQAATVAWLDGKPKEARDMLRGLSNKHKNEGSSGSSTGRRLEQAVDSLTEFGKIEAKSIPKITNEIDVMVVIASGLKNWASGHTLDAQDLFKMAQSFPVAEPSEELRYYLSQINNYKNDAKVLEPFRASYKPLTLADVNSRRSKLEQAEKKLKTKGRVRFDIKEWYHQLSIHELRIKREEQARIDAAKKAEENKRLQNGGVEVWQEFFTEISGDLDNAEFTKPVKRLELKKFSNEKNGQRKGQMIYLCNMANGYKATLKRTLSAKRTSAKVELKEGNVVYTSIYGAQDGGVEVMEGGRKKLIPWSKVKAKSLVDLHKFNVQGDLSGFERNLRLEQAVAFAWLTGETEKAKTGADMLKGKNEIFKNRWKHCMELLGQ